MKSDQEIDEALASEFAGYLSSISKEIVKPIREETKNHKSEIDRLTASIDQAGTRVGSLLEAHHKQLSSEARSLLTALDVICKQMREVVEGVSAANEVTREKLLLEAASISTAVGNGVVDISGTAQGMREALDHSLSEFHAQTEPWIDQAGKSIELAMASKMRTAEEKLQAVVEQSIQGNLRKLEAPLSAVIRLRYWLLAVSVLQVATIGALLVRG